MNGRNRHLLMALGLLGGAQMAVGLPECAAQAVVPGAPVCNEADVDKTDEAAICEARRLADAERADCAHNISCKHEWLDLIRAWEDQRAHVSEASRR